MSAPSSEPLDRLPDLHELPALDAQRHRLSCLLDGDLDGAGADAACTRWRDDHEMRATWHRYHLIGDVMRSSELANSPDRDALFLARYRERLAGEPAILAPVSEPESAPRAGRSASRWIAPAAIAAGFVAVAGVLVVTRISQPGAQPGPTLASAPPPAVDLRPAGMSSGASAPGWALAAPDAVIDRNPEIDRYLRAHREMRALPASALPGGAPRQVELLVAPQR